MRSSFDESQVKPARNDNEDENRGQHEHWMLVKQYLYRQFSAIDRLVLPDELVVQNDLVSVAVNVRMVSQVPHNQEEAQPHRDGKRNDPVFSHIRIGVNQCNAELKNELRKQRSVQPRISHAGKAPFHVLQVGQVVVVNA